MEQLLETYILGLPLIAWGGLFSGTLIIATFLTGLKRAPLKIHQRLAYTALAFALLHGLAGLFLVIF
ncbi:MAG: hypothetical protein WC405_20020 [Syntrophales bacterium]